MFGISALPGGSKRFRSELELVQEPGLELGRSLRCSVTRFLNQLPTSVVVLSEPAVVMATAGVSPPTFPQLLPVS